MATSSTNEVPARASPAPEDPVPAAAPDAPAPDRVVVGTFECTIEDYREATLNVRGSAWRAAVLPTLSIAYTGGLWLWMAWITAGGSEAQAGRTAAAGVDSLTHLLARTAAVMAPVLIGIPLVFFVTFRYAAGRSPAPWSPRFDPRRGRGAAVARLVLIMVVGIITFTVWTTSGAADWYDRFLVMTVLLYAFLLLAVFNLLLRTTGTNRRWAAQPWLHRLTTVEASGAGMTLAEPEARHAYRWASFVGFKETPNLLLIYPSPYEHWVVPKRAFASRADLIAFKALLATHVRSGFFLPEQEPTGFPMPTAPVPLPVVPLGPAAGVGPPPLPHRAAGATTPAPVSVSPHHQPLP